ncbi:MAG: prepilin-type N-terminal cleavage/methylation domain-containing protein [Gemmataceae bacterium]|nr:prepilin-type N-terminal cleavage/methylation domain-containing protein [Gemmataceae bacterium]
MHANIATRNRRPGATLIEVLVAIFLMGIGMLALLTLFPIGVLRMAQAINDERAAQASASAVSVANIKDLRHDSSLTSPTDLFKQPDASLTVADPDGRSYGVFIDPAGWLNALGAFQSFAGGEKAAPRVLPSFIQTSTGRGLDTLRWFAINDDVIFDPDTALPKPNASSFDRDTRFTYAYLMQRPRLSDASLVEMSVLVFNRRPITLRGDLTPAENAYPASYDTSKNMVTLDFSAPTAVAPTLAAGDWIYDCSVQNSATNPGTAAPHAYFYRVVSINDLGGNKLQIEVQTPLRGFPANALTAGRVMVLDGLYEVFEKGAGRLP